MFLSSRWDGKCGLAGAGAGLDERPDSIAADGDLVAMAVEVDRDRLASGRTAVGEVAAADLPAGLRGAEGVEGACAGGACAGPRLAVPFPYLGFEFGAVAVPVDEGEGVITVAGNCQDPGVAGMPAAAVMTSSSVRPG